MGLQMTCLTAITLLCISAADASEPFNLVCTGTLSSRSMDGETKKPYRSVYRIDLDRGKWCDGDCEALHDIASVQPTQIALQDKRVDTPSERSMMANLIDRRTGEHTVTATSATPGLRGSVLIMQWHGQCERAPFTGFPSFETKF
ncbi:MAG: hypothetical protein ACOY45_11335 [Pseudomonadota bacterium]